MQDSVRERNTALTEVLEGRVLLSVSMVKDLETTPRGSFDNDSQPLVSLGSAVYFDLGNELWKSDGTAAGTARVKNFGSFFPLSATRVGSVLYFPATDNNGDWQLWKSDGTAAGTSEITDLPAIDPALDYANFTAAGGTLFFTQTNGAAGSTTQFTLFKSDGTAAGTVPIMSFNKSATQEFDNLGMVAANGKLIFTTADPTAGTDFWASDGTAAGTLILGHYNPPFLAPAGNEVFFTTLGVNAGEWVLWKTDGTVAGTVMVAPLAIPNTSAPLSSLVGVGSGVYAQYQNLSQLWHSDGTAAGTMQVATVTPDALSDTPTIADVNGTAFLVENRFHELWKSNGTPAGTVMLKSFTGTIGEMANPNGKLVFAADDGTNGSELWISDGTATGTTLLKDINPGAGASSPAQFSAVGSKLFFTAFDPVAGRELWTSDGTSAGTRLVVDLTPGTEAFDFGAQQVTAGNTLFFTGHPFGPDAGLYRSDGTSAGTFQLSAGNVVDVAGDGTAVYFVVEPTTGDKTLWKTDGTVAGTLSIAAIMGDDQLVVVNGKAFYSTTAGFPGGLFVAGPGAGTPLKLTTGTIDEMVAFNGLLYYVVETTRTTSPFTTTYALWKTDGTAAGTSQVISFSGALDQLLPVGSSLYFEAADGTNSGLWVSDGTAAGTQFLSNVTPEFDVGAPPHTAVLNGRLVFPGLDTGGVAPELWITDGTPAGTQLISSLMTPEGDPLSPQELTTVGGVVYFVAGDAITGTWQLWKTDGTAAGTAVVVPQIGDTTGDTPSIAAFDGALYFAGNLDPTIGPELYTADAGGVTLVADIAPGATGSSPDQLTATDQALFFIADDGVHGRELWQFSQPAQSLFGRVFDDVNNDGFQQPTEHGLAGITVYLDANNNGSLDSGEVHTTTDANGDYVFANLPTGTYTVRQVLPTGWARTEPLSAATTAVVAANRAAPGPVFGNVQISTVPLNFNYLLKLAQHFGQSGTFATGDLDGDGTVDFNDLLILAQNYGHALPSATAASTPLVPAYPDDSLDSPSHKAGRARHLL